jgi:tetratricopeptide (TPR) repeat protein
MSRGFHLLKARQFEAAIDAFTRVIETDPNNAEADNQLATLLAHCPDHKYRDSARALQMAKKAVALNPTPEFLNTLASAHAEAGQFKEAVLVQRRAVQLLQQHGNSARLMEFRKRLSAYTADTPMKQHAVVPFDGKVYTTAQPANKRYVVQAGAFLLWQNAEKRKSFLIGKGYGAAIVPFTDAKGRIWHTVRIGNYMQKQEALTAATDLAKKVKVATNVRIQNAL